jgi:hypothetical protein
LSCFEFNKMFSTEYVTMFMVSANRNHMHNFQFFITYQYSPQHPVVNHYISGMYVFSFGINLLLPKQTRLFNETQSLQD